VFGVDLSRAAADRHKRLLAYSVDREHRHHRRRIGLTILFAVLRQDAARARQSTLTCRSSTTRAQPRVLQEACCSSPPAPVPARSAQSAASASSGGLSTGCRWVAWLRPRRPLSPAPALPPRQRLRVEWLLLQAFLFTPSLPQSFVNMLVAARRRRAGAAAALAAT
jgi:hypothetical protein